MHGPCKKVALGEHWWAICLTGLILYLTIQLKASHKGEDQSKHIVTVKKLLCKGQIHLSGAVAAKLRGAEMAALAASVNGSSEYQ